MVEIRSNPKIEYMIIRNNLKKKENNKFRGLDKSLRIQRIIDAATELFYKKGYRATTLDDVAKKIGVTKAALYHYVSSKENLLSVIYMQALESIFRNTNKMAVMNLPPDEKLRLIIGHHIKNISIKSLPILSVFFAEENQLSSADLKGIQNEKKKYNQMIENIIEEGIEQGLFRKTDPKLQAYGILGVCNWIYKWYKADKTPYTPDQIAGHLINLLEKGYLASEMIEDGTAEKQELEQMIKSRSADKKQILNQLKEQCQVLIDMIDNR
ncbi:MAG: TetR family transcriptional regulator [Desulfosarcina sp.]|nr:TetR family transcriptional regulator [Desulfobacterales bacterium]